MRIECINLKGGGGEGREKERKEESNRRNRGDVAHMGTRFSSRYTHKFQAENVDEIGGTP